MSELSLNDRIEEELRELAATHAGVIPPRAVVDFARDPETALHTKFTWDDSEAAEAWRLHQARRVLQVYVTVVAGKTEPVRTFVSLTTDLKAGGGYRLTVDVLANDEMREQMIHDATAELRRVRLKYKHLHELAEVWTAVEHAEQAHLPLEAEGDQPAA
jgi:hypothetical protein